MIKLYIIGSPLDTARALDPERLRKQIDDVSILIDNINLKLHTRRRGKYWNDPLVDLYLPHVGWLYSYIEVLDLIRCDGNFSVIERCNNEAELCKPDFHNQEFFDKQKRILFEEDNERYFQWFNI